jgi:Ethanolamine utilization protein EutJ (predicted chaperonin)
MEALTDTQQDLVVAFLAAEQHSNRKRKVEVRAPEAATIARIQKEVVEFVTSIAVTRARAMKSEYLLGEHIEFARTQLLRGSTGGKGAAVANTLGSVLLGVGIPVLIGLIADPPTATAFTLWVAVGTVTVGSVVTTLSFVNRRR